MPEPKFTLDRYIFLYDDPFDEDLIGVTLVEGEEDDPREHAEEWRVESGEDMQALLAHAKALAEREGGLSVVNAWACAHCDKGLGGDYYMVHDEVWALAEVPGLCQLHLKCLEERIGRRLTIEDFTDARCNHLIRFGYSLAEPE